jgi:hypothetical protein
LPSSTSCASAPQRADARENDAGDDGGRFEQRDKKRHVRFVRDVAPVQECGGDREGDHADRTVMRRDRCCIGPGETAEAAQNRVGGQREDESHCDHRASLHCHAGERQFGELHSAFESDGQQQEDRERFIHCIGQAQVGPGELGEHAQQKEEDHGIHDTTIASGDGAGTPSPISARDRRRHDDARADAEAAVDVLAHRLSQVGKVAARAQRSGQTHFNRASLGVGVAGRMTQAWIFGGNGLLHALVVALSRTDAGRK